MSRSVSLIDLAASLVRRAESAADGDHINVIPVVVDSLEAVLPVLRAVCDVVDEGRLLNTLDDELQGPVPGTLSEARRAAIEEAITGEPYTERRVRLTTTADGLTDAVFEDGSGSQSEGEQTVLAVARAVAHADLDNKKLVIIAYKENLIDFSFRRGIWSLAVRQLNNRHDPKLRTMVFVAENAIDVGHHCETGFGFQLAIDGERILYRKPPDSVTAAAISLAGLQNPYVLFLGAGFSISSGMPMGNSMRDYAIRRLLGIGSDESVTSVTLARRFYDWIFGQGWLTQRERELSKEQFASRLTLERVIDAEQRMDATLPTLTEFKKTHDLRLGTPGPAVLNLASLLPSAAGKVVLVTVNFDLFVETTFPNLRVFVTDDEFQAASDYLKRYFAGEEDAIPYLKLHGTITDFASCVMTAEQTEEGIRAPKLDALRVLTNTEHPYPWVYVGASMRDLDLRPLLLYDGDFRRGVDERWVCPYLDESVGQFAADRESAWRHTEFADIDSRLITETADAFFAALNTAYAAAAH